MRAATRGQRGSATVTILALATAVWMMAAALMMVGQVRAARHRAGAAADLAALAGAQSSAADRSGCQAAAEVARRNRARLVRCVTDGIVVDVLVEVPVGRPASGLTGSSARGRARAGPVWMGGWAPPASEHDPGFPGHAGFTAPRLRFRRVADRFCPVPATRGTTTKGNTS